MSIEILYITIDALLFIVLFATYTSKSILTPLRIALLFTSICISCTIFFMCSTVENNIFFLINLIPFYKNSHTHILCSMIIVTAYMATVTFFLFFVCSKMRILKVSTKENIYISILSGCSLPYVLFFLPQILHTLS